MIRQLEIAIGALVTMLFIGFGTIVLIVSLPFVVLSLILVVVGVGSILWGVELMGEVVDRGVDIR